MFCNKFHAVTKRSQMHPNTMKLTEAFVQGPMGWWGALVSRLRGKNFCINYTSSVCFVTSLMQLRNHPKCTQILRNAPKHWYRVQWLRSLWKIPTWLRLMNFCNNCTSSTHFALSFMQLRNVPKCIQALWDKPKHEFRVQWGGSSAFVAKNYNVTSGHELLY